MAIRNKKYLNKVRRSILNVTKLSQVENSSLPKAERFVSFLYSANTAKKRILADDFYFDFSIKIKRNNGKTSPSLRIINHNYYSQKEKHPAGREIAYRKRGQAIKHVFGTLDFLSGKNRKTLDYLLDKTYDKNFLLPVQFGANFEKGKDALKVYFWCGIAYPNNEIRYKKLKDILKKEGFGCDISFLKKRKIGLFSFDFSKRRKGAKIYVIHRMNSKSFYADLKKFGFRKEDIAGVKKFYLAHKNCLHANVTICYNVSDNALSIKKIEFFLKNESKGRTRVAKEIAEDFIRRFSKKLDTSSLPDDFLKEAYAYAVGERFIAIYFSKIKAEKT
jgi:hypothetical protein